MIDSLIIFNVISISSQHLLLAEILMSNVACCFQAFRFSGLVHPGDLIHDATDFICVSIRLLSVLARIQLSFPLFSLLLLELSVLLFHNIE